MKVTYDFTKDDIWNYGKHVTFSMPKFRRRMATNILMVPLLVSAIGYTMKFTIASYITYGIGFTLFYVFVLVAVLKGKVVKSNSGPGGLYGKHSIDIGVNGIKESLPEREENHSWNEIQKVVEDKKYIYIHWSEAGAHVVPKRAFSKPEHAKFFFTTALNHFEKVKSKVS